MLKYINSHESMTLVVDAFQQPKEPGSEVKWEQLVIEPGCSGRLVYPADAVEVSFRPCTLPFSQFEVMADDDGKWYIGRTQEAVDHEEWIFATYEEAEARLNQHLFG